MTEPITTDHDLLIRMDEKLNGITTSIGGVKDEVKELDKRLTLQEQHSDRQDGAISALKWVVGVTIPLLAIAISIITWWFNRG